LVDKKEYNLLCGAETETRVIIVSTFVVLKMLGPVQWDLDIYVKILIVRINECLYSRTIINMCAPAETADQEKCEYFNANLLTLLHNMTL
jgi:hypothetical protein